MTEPLNDRRVFLALLAAAGTATLQLQAAPARTRIAGTFPLPAPFDKQTATLVEVYCAAGEQSAAHRHPGFVLGYVIEGEYRFQVAGEPERTVRAGETFYEAPGAKHVVSASASTDKPARLLAIVIAEAGKTITERL